LETPPSKRDAQTHLAELGYLPFAIEQTAAYIAETGCSLTGFLTKFRQSRYAVYDRQPDTTEQTYRRTLTTTWRLSFDQINRQNPMASRLFEACAFLHPDVIPVTLLERGDDIFELSERSASNSNRLLDIDEAIGVLIKYSFVKRKVAEHEEEGLTIDQISVHRLVQDIVRQKQSSEEVIHHLRVLTQSLRQILTDRERLLSGPRSWLHTSTYAPAVEAFAKHLTYFYDLGGVFQSLQKIC